MMNLERITSLADLIFKAKSNPYYRQLAVLAYKYLAYGSQWRRYVGKEISNKQFDDAVKYLNDSARHTNPPNCINVCRTVNDFRTSVVEVVVKPKEEAKPEVAAVEVKAEVDEAKVKKKDCDYEDIMFDQYYKSFWKGSCKKYKYW